MRAGDEERDLKVVSIVQGKFGERFVEHMQKTAPESWEVIEYHYKAEIPAMVDDPDEILPDDLPHGDLLLYLGQTRKLSELISDIALACRVQGVVAAVDNRAILPTGLGNQVKRRLAKKGVDAVLADPCCALCETHSDNPVIREFARHYGEPDLNVAIENGKISNITVIRGAPCGNSHYAANGLEGVEAGESLERVRKLHREHPCMASMDVDQETKDTLMNRAAQLLENAVKQAMEKEI